MSIVTLGAPPRPLPARAGRWLWATVVVDCAALPWLLVEGGWLDGCSRLCQVATLGGHHVIVMLLAGLGLLVLGALAPFTRGFAEATPVQVGALVMGCLASLIALAGIVSVGLLIALLVFTALLFLRALSR